MDSLIYCPVDKSNSEEHLPEVHVSSLPVIFHSFPQNLLATSFALLSAFVSCKAV